MSESEQSDEHEEQGAGEGDAAGVVGGFAENPLGGAGGDTGGEEPSSQDPSDFTNYPAGESQGEGEAGGKGEAGGDAQGEDASEGE